MLPFISSGAAEAADIVPIINTIAMIATLKYDLCIFIHSPFIYS